MFRNETLIQCPKCGTLAKGKTGFFRKTIDCPSCGNIIDPARDAMKVVKCQGCGCNVMFDTTKGGSQICPNCFASLSDYAVESFEAECPSCHVTQKIRYNETEHTCPVCGKVFDAKAVKSKADTESAATASVITVPAGNDCVIWEHPMSVFPYAAQLIVPEGYTALILRDGRCLAQSEPGKYLLSDTTKSQAEILEQAVLDASTQVSVKIYFVKKVLDASRMKWGGAAVTVKDAEGRIMGRLGFGGEVEVSVVDAKAFAESYHYQTLTEKELFPEYTGENETKIAQEIRKFCHEAAETVLRAEARNHLNYNYAALEDETYTYKAAIRDRADELLQEKGLKTSWFTVAQLHFLYDPAYQAWKAQEKKKKEDAEAAARKAWQETEAKRKAEAAAKLAAEVQKKAEQEKAWQAAIAKTKLEKELQEKKEAEEKAQREAEAKAAREKQEAEVKARRDTANYIRTKVESLTEWNSPTLQIHLKDRLECYADVVFGGEVSFMIVDDSRLFSTARVNGWVEDSPQNGLPQAEIDRWWQNLVNSQMVNALNDTLQPLIDRTEADIRDMTTYYPYIRQQIEARLPEFFSLFGLQKISFNMVQKNFRKSVTLDLLTESVAHKTEAQLKDQMDAFDRERRMKKKADDSEETIYNKLTDDRTTVSVDNSQTDTEAALAANNEKKADSMIRNINTDARVQMAAAQAAANVAAQGEALIHQAKLVGMDYQTEESLKSVQSEAAVDKAQTAVKQEQKVNEVRNGAVIEEEMHRTEMDDIRHQTEKAQALNYLNEMRIRDKAEQLHVEWEAKSRLEKEELQHELELRQMRREDELKQRQDQRQERMADVNLEIRVAEANVDSKHHIAQTDAENEQIINSIMRKVADSNLDLWEKKAALERLLKNQNIEDDLRHQNEKGDADTRRMYADRHLKNLLDQEEKDYLDQRTDRDLARRRSTDEWNFAVEMQRKEKETADQMERLKMQYEREKYQYDMEMKLREKDREIEIMKLQISAQTTARDQDIREKGMTLDAYTRMNNAEINAEAAANKAARDERRAQAEREYSRQHDAAERESSMRREQARADREERYHQSAVDLMEKMAAIQAEIQKMDLVNERIRIQENAGVEKAKAVADAQKYEAEIDRRISDMKTMLDEINQKVADVSQAAAPAPAASAVYTSGSHTIPVEVEIPTIKLTPDSPRSNASRTTPVHKTVVKNTKPAAGYDAGAKIAQPGAVCPHCGAAVRAGATYCDHCFRSLVTY